MFHNNTFLLVIYMANGHPQCYGRLFYLTYT
nr:MAG TPA: hypothetical protein [Caudoviricetes sp.]